MNTFIGTQINGGLMDSLLQYALYKITWLILTLEGAIMVAACLALIGIRALTKWKQAKDQRIQNEISTIIESVIVKAQSLENLELPSRLQSFKNLVEVLEKYDQRLSDPIWKDTKKKLIEIYMLRKAESMSHSYSWVNRQLAARCYLLLPQKAPETDLEKLLGDSKYLVRVVAAVCITQISNKNLFYKMLEQMNREYVLSRFSYRDALIQSDSEKFLWIEELLKKNPNPGIAAICLDILSTRLSHNLFPIIKMYVSHKNQACRLLAIKALANIPSEESIKILQQHLFDTSWEIRAESIEGLSKLHVVDAIPQLHALLNDSIWWVRLQAALGLKKFGQRGQEILLSQTPETAQAYEISQYALSLPQ